MEKSAKLREEMLMQLITQIRINHQLFEELLKSIKKKNLKNLVMRIKMQKDLFIKELKRIFEDKSFDFSIHSSIEKDTVENLMLEHASENIEETCFNIIRLREKQLLEIYDELIINILKMKLPR